MDTSETYIKMCGQAPKGITKFDYSDHREFVACTYHKCLVEYDEGYHEWQCPDMEKKQREILARPIAARSRDRAWNRLQKSDDWCEGKHWVRLPRQDQLQEMVFEGLPLSEEIPCAMLTLLYEFGHVTKNNNAEYWHGCQSMEQLWLAFVMKEKYNKVWDGESWKTDI